MNSKKEYQTQIGNRGYTIVKEDVSSSELQEMRKQLTVQPFVNSSYLQNVPSFPIYMESQRKLYLPRYFGIEHLGPPKTLSIQEGTQMNKGVSFQGNLKPVQKPIIEAFLQQTKNKPYGGGIISVPCGYGKCLAKGTKVIMYDGKCKNVEKICVGDILMGDDFTKRNVLSICKGNEMMVHIKTSNGLSYKVNESHILSLVKDANTPQEKLLDISIENYLKMSKEEQSTWKGYQVPVVFKKQKRYFVSSPYNYGYTLDKKIEDYYLYNSFETRFALLGGIYDKYGVITNSENVNNYFRLFFGKYNPILYNFEFLLHSLGIEFSKNENETTKIIIYRMKIHTMIQPFLHSKKVICDEVCNMNYFEKYTKSKITHSITIHYDTIDEYYGFTLDNNHRFLLENGIVTHNTVLAIHIAAELQRKTLVVVHKEFLMNQWKERIQQFLPNAKIGKIQSNVIDIKNKDIVLGMLQSISMIDYPPETFRNFGFVIYDECHHLGAEVFSRSLLKTSCPYTLGLSATPNRQDGLTKVFHWYLGPMIYQIKKREDKNVDVRMYHFSDSNQDYSKEVVNFMGKPNSAQMINNITSFKPRIDLLFNLLLPLLKEGRKILVLSDRKNHLSEIKKKIEDYALVHKESFPYSAGYYLGGMKACDLEKTEKDNIILGTFAMASEGFDCREPLDTIVLGSPKSNIEQAVGRILRQEEKDRKFVPLVLDIVDEFATFPRQALKRAKFYKTNEYRIHTFNQNMESIPNKYVKSKNKGKAQKNLDFLPDSD